MGGAGWKEAPQVPGEPAGDGGGLNQWRGGWCRPLEIKLNAANDGLVKRWPRGCSVHHCRHVPAPTSLRMFNPSTMHKNFGLELRKLTEGLRVNFHPSKCPSTRCPDGWWEKRFQIQHLAG